MTIYEGMQKGISTFRRPNWAPQNYITVDIGPKGNEEGYWHGPWMHVWRPKEWDEIEGLCDIPNPQHVLFTWKDENDDWEECEHTEEPEGEK